MNAVPEMLSVGDAQTRILREVKVLPAETVALPRALGRVLAADIYASTDLPPFANSSMDGYAVRAQDIAHASESAPSTLQVMADIAAGHSPDSPLAPGSAARITTGAPLPAGADSVVPVEMTDDDLSFTGAPLPKQVSIFQAVAEGAHVRRAGEDVRAGERVLPKHTQIGPASLGLLAALGVFEVGVFRLPRVAILGSGDELVELDETLGPGKIRNVNSYTVAALVTQYGGIPLSLGIARDTVESVEGRLQDAVRQQADLILTSAGVSMGASDVIRLALEKAGEIQFWRVNIRPGKPAAFGRYHDIPWLGLPGNPVSSVVACEVFARPAILKMGGHSSVERPSVRVRLQEQVRSDGRETYFRARVVYDATSDEYVAHSAGGQGSHMLGVLANANAFVIIPAGVTEVDAGSTLTAWLLSEAPVV